MSFKAHHLYTSFAAYADSAQCNFCCKPTIYGCKRRFGTRLPDTDPCAEVSCKNPKFGCGWVPNLRNVMKVPSDLETKSGGYNTRIRGPDPNMRELMPDPKKAKCLACSDITSVLPEDKMVGCVPYTTEEQHFEILRSDGLSHHPLRKHKADIRPYVGKNAWKAPMGLFSGQDMSYPYPADWVHQYRKSMPYVNDFLLPDEKNGGADRVNMTGNSLFEAGKRQLSHPVEELMAAGIGARPDPDLFRIAVGADPSNMGKYYAKVYMPELAF
ncbi:unnamed protein product [Amoebophrya sp. A120]|nr:unnamed protein product [Amoebophrya sp. A120]|eukprot:GSA120T00021295001.1